VQNNREWAALCKEVLSLPELVDDPRFRTNPDRVRHDDELTPLLEEVFADRSADEVIDLLDAAGIANARLRGPGDLNDHPQLRARDRWRDVDTPAGSVQALLPPVESGREPVMGAVPALGEHNDAVRAEFGRLSA
jgi:itaconate CoA-transferase